MSKTIRARSKTKGRYWLATDFLDNPNKLIGKYLLGIGTAKRRSFEESRFVAIWQIINIRKRTGISAEEILIEFKVLHGTASKSDNYVKTMSLTDMKKISSTDRYVVNGKLLSKIVKKSNLIMY